ncbi:related to monooxigenase [Cephalotrichum gorgonifer]|uniref:Related to monooxigenase n=1 Tax=Cephalotrichum gorgonifer TaxID=2041049 RepID=A0AAE8MYN9_9PEZI|nr:related to monooxigenase [Cephalotrichum gorgonifer]
MTADQTRTPEVDGAKLHAIRQRYSEEAKKRLRPDSQAQFIQLASADEERFRALVEDPWVDHETLDATQSHFEDNSVYKFFVLGAGFGGLQFAVRLLESGLATPDDIRLADAAGGFGGTWYWNRYPGLHCDLESYMYLPLLEETGYIPKHKYSTGEEIREHAERIAATWRLADKALFCTEVKSAELDDGTQLWTVKLEQRRSRYGAPANLQLRAQYVYLAAGVLTRPQIPNIPGILSFSGPMLHTARWNYGVTGGSPTNQALSGLTNKKVAVVGTAATTIGVIPEIAKFAGELYVIQRTPAYVKRRDQRPTDLEEFKTQVANKQGWQFERQCNWNSHITNSVKPGQVDLVADGWTDMPAYSAVMGSPSHGIVDPSPENLEKHATNFHALDLPHMEAVRGRVETLVKDRDTAAKLKPWYPSWCKRPTFSDTYLQTFNKSHVHLIDTDGQGPSKATERGLVIGDKEYPFDVIIFGTGFQLSSRLGSPAARTGIHILGRDGQSLDDKWQENGAATLHGYATNGFPNLFFSGGSQGTITGNNVMMLAIIANHVTYMISEAERRAGPGKRAIIEVAKDAEEAHTAEIVRRAPFYSALAGCTPGYFNGHGEGVYITDPREKQKRARGGAWSEGTLFFLDYIQKWRDEGSLKGLTVEPAR